MVRISHSQSTSWVWFRVPDSFRLVRFRSLLFGFDGCFYGVRFFFILTIYLPATPIADVYMQEFAEDISV